LLHFKIAADVNSALRFLGFDVGYVAEISELHAASIFGVEDLK
jgi:hypothetical protein